MDVTTDLGHVGTLERMSDPLRRAQEATTLLGHYQLMIATIARVRRGAIEEAHDDGRTYAQVAHELGLTPGRLSQIRHANHDLPAVEE